MDIYTQEVLQEINSDNWNFTPPNGESQRDVEERMIGWWLKERMIQETYEKDLVTGVFSHGMAIKCFLRGMMNFDAELTYKIALYNTSITRLKFSKLGLHLITTNDAGHLLGEEKILDHFEF